MIVVLIVAVENTKMQVFQVSTLTGKDFICDEIKCDVRPCLLVDLCLCVFQ